MSTVALVPADFERLARSVLEVASRTERPQRYPREVVERAHDQLDAMETAIGALLGIPEGYVGLLEKIQRTTGWEFPLRVRSLGRSLGDLAATFREEEA